MYLSTEFLLMLGGMFERVKEPRVLLPDSVSFFVFLHSNVSVSFSATTRHEAE